MAALGVGLTLVKGRGQTSGSTTAALPDRLAYVATSGQSGWQSRVYFRKGGSVDPAAVGKGGSGLRAGPYLNVTAGPEGDHDGVLFEWTGDGRRAWILSKRGGLYVVPGAREVAPGPVRSAAFSPDGSQLAICSQHGWPPRIQVVPMSDEEMGPRSAIEGCFPRWSADGVYVAHRLPAAANGVYRAGLVGVLNTRLRVTFRARGGWPAAWATAPGYVFSPLTVVSPDRRDVLIMSPRGGRARTLVPSASLTRFAGAATAPIVAMAWSREGDRLAVAVDNGPEPGADGVVVVDVQDETGDFLALPRAPSSLSWGPGGRLLVELRRDRRYLTFEWRPGHEATTLPGYRQASWSPDGRWILARNLTTWFAVDADHPDRRVPFAASSHWYRAGWCCPPIPVTRLEG